MPAKYPKTSGKNIPKNINGYEYFIYLWLIVETDLKYCGYHKGIPLRDGYYHSSTNEDFNLVFSDANSKLEFSVISYGAYIEMLNLEHKILSENDARNNPLYYNLNNGFEKDNEPDLDLCDEFVEEFEILKTYG